MPAAAKIDRLTVELTGLSEPAARRLVELVAHALAGPVSRLEPRRVPALRVELDAAAGQTLPDLAHRIVVATLGALRRTA